MMNLRQNADSNILARVAFNICRGTRVQLLNKIRERDAARLEGSLAVSRYIIQYARSRVHLTLFVLSRFIYVVSCSVIAYSSLSSFVRVF